MRSLIPTGATVFAGSFFVQRKSEFEQFLLFHCEKLRLVENQLKVTVQFETEGNSQNEIFSHMDRSEVKL